MNDTELDNLLNTWTTPDPPPSLRGRARAGYATLSRRRAERNAAAASSINRMDAAASYALTPKPRRRFRLSSWTIAFGFAAFLLVLTAALPKTVELVVPAQKIPYTVDIDTTTFGRDGTVHELRMTTYMRDGVEIILSQTGNPLKAFAIQTFNAAYSAYSLVFPPVDPHRWAEFVASGCQNVPDHGIRLAEPWVRPDEDTAREVGTVVGHETILGYRTTVTRHLLPSRDEGDVLQNGRIITLWQAPDLGCFDLKLVHEQQNSDGTYRLVEENHALKVTVNPP